MANILVALLTVGAGYGGVVDPQTSSIPAILAMTFPAWLMLSVVMLIADFFLKRVTAVVPVLSFIIVLPPFLDYSPMHLLPGTLSADEKERSFTVMSFNVLGLENTLVENASSDPAQWQRDIAEGAVNNTVSYIIDAGADILALQESPAIGVSKRLHVTQSQVDSIRSMYTAPATVHGEIIYSRYPLTPVELRQPDSRYAWFCGAITKIMGHEVLVISLHFESIGLSNEDRVLFQELTEGEGRHKMRQVKSRLLSKLSNAFRNRAQQARLLREQIDSLGVENVIIAGDFNDIPGCYAIRTLCGDDFRNAFSDGGCGPTITYHADRFYFHIDHILYRGKMKAVDFRRGNCPNSDHYPVMATFVWEDTPPSDPEN